MPPLLSNVTFVLARSSGDGRGRSITTGPAAPVDHGPSVTVKQRGERPEDAYHVDGFLQKSADHDGNQVERRRNHADQGQRETGQHGLQHHTLGAAGDGDGPWNGGDVVVHDHHLHVPGTETDYENIANEFCAQFAAGLNAAPRWFSGKPDDAAAAVKERVFDAYYGTDYPNFCFGFGVMMRFDDPESSQRYQWEAGSGMNEPTGEGKYGDYFSWGMAADACRDEAGNWYVAGTWTGGGGIWLPYIGSSWDSAQNDATAAQLIDCWFLSAGESHEWRLPNMLYARPGAELRKAFAALTPEQAAELETGLRAVWDDPLYAESFPGGFDAKCNAD